MKHLTFFLLLLALYSCQPATEKHEAGVKIDSSAIKFKTYLANFKKIDFPVVIKGCEISGEGLNSLEQGSRAYGQVPTNGDYIALVTLGAADCYLPVLTTYKPNGDVIATKAIAIGGCGSGCGFHCEEFMTIKDDYTFYTSDTINVYECDSTGEEIAATHESYVIYKKGKILKNGEIEISEEIKESLLKKE